MDYGGYSPFCYAKKQKHLENTASQSTTMRWFVTWRNTSGIKAFHWHFPVVSRIGILFFLNKSMMKLYKVILSKRISVQKPFEEYLLLESSSKVEKQNFSKEKQFLILYFQNECLRHPTAYLVSCVSLGRKRDSQVTVGQHSVPVCTLVVKTTILEPCKWSASELGL